MKISAIASRASCVLAIMTCALSAACGAGGTEDLAQEVRADMIRKFASDKETAGIRVGELTLVHRGGNDYRGLVELADGAESTQATVEVTYDGSSLIWQIAQ